MPEYEVHFAGFQYVWAIKTFEAASEHEARETARDFLAKEGKAALDWQDDGNEVEDVDICDCLDMDPDELTENQDFAHDDDLVNLEASDIL